MIVVGLTGSIAMGKSTVGAMFAKLGAPVFDSDAAVRDIYSGPTASAVEALFPGVVKDGQVDRERLSERVLSDPAALKRLEEIIHPVVKEARGQFLEKAVAAGRRIAAVDIPLLLETGAEDEVDLVVVVSAPAEVQSARALGREGMTETKLRAILSRQLSDEDKRRRAHFIIDTSGSFQRTEAQVRQFMRAVASLEGRRPAHA